MTEPTHAPLPYDWVASATAAYGNMFHAYLTDATGRKIAAVWGKEGEKAKTADLLMTAANCHADLLKALKAAASALRSYQLGNSSPDLAEEIAAAVDLVVARAEGRT